jgi:hypothetical protein
LRERDALRLMIAGLASATDILHRAYTSAIAVFRDGEHHHDDLTCGDHAA